MSPTRDPSAATGASGDGRGRELSPGVRRLLYIAAYYAVAGGALVAAWRYSPAVRSLLESHRVSELATGGSLGNLTEPGGILAAAPTGWPPGFATLLALAGALFTALPVAWVYSLTRRKRGFEQSMVHTLVLLPVAVAGTVMLIQNSLALAFGLTGIVAMLRFRNTLEDTKDGVYIFIAMSVGISAAAGVLVVGIATSVIFNVTVLVLWGLDFARAPTPGLRGGIRRPAPRPAPVAASAGALVAEPNGRYNATLRVHTADTGSSQAMVEDVLGDHAKRWELVRIARADGGQAMLEYRVRVRRSSRGELLEALHAAGSPVTGAELQ